MSEEQENRGFKYQVWIMLLMVAGVMLAGFLMMPSNEEERQQLIEFFGTTNQGQLVKPAINLSALMATEDATAENSKWRIFIITGDVCDDVCEQVIHDTRQVHIRLGKLANRVERILLPPPGSLFAGSTLEQRLHEENPYLKIRQLDREMLRHMLGGSNADWNMLEPRYFVMTPDNRAILYFTAADESAGLLEDLKHLLKYSPDR